MNRKIIEEDLKHIVSTELPWEKLEGKNILISGANGFLPSYMAETILFLNSHIFQNKAKVFLLARNQKRLFSRFLNYLARDDIEFIIQDVNIPIKKNSRFDYIIHAASQASPKYYGVDPVGTILTNTVGTSNLLNLAVDSKSECFIFFSSGSVYGKVHNKNLPIKENFYGYLDPTHLRSCYSEGKRAGECMCVAWSKQYGLPVRIIRPFHTYGPGMILDDGRVFADFVSDIISNRNIKIKSDGSKIRAFCYLADAVIGFFTITFKGLDQEAYNVGNENCKISISDLANMLVGLFPEKKLKIERIKRHLIDNYIESNTIVSYPDTSKLRNLGWVPHYSLEEGFKRTVSSFIE